MIRRLTLALLARATEPPPERARVIRLEAQNVDLRRENMTLLGNVETLGAKLKAADAKITELEEARDCAATDHRDAIKDLHAKLATADARIVELSDLAATLDARVGELTAQLDGERWIPCAERMPAAGVPVLIATIDDQTIMGAIFETGTVFRAAWGDGSIGVLAIDLSRAWRPIPTYTPEPK